MPFFLLKIKQEYTDIFENVFGGTQNGSILVGDSNEEKKIWFSSMPTNTLIYWLGTNKLYKIESIRSMALVESFTEINVDFTVNDQDWIDSEENYSSRFNFLFT